MRDWLRANTYWHPFVHVAWLAHNCASHLSLTHSHTNTHTNQYLLPNQPVLERKKPEPSEARWPTLTDTHTPTTCMAKLQDGSTDVDHSNQERDKHKLQQQQEQYHQLQRDLADAISRLASLDDIRILLACGAKVDGPVTQGLHPIHYAAYQNFVPAVRVSVTS